MSKDYTDRVIADQAGEIRWLWQQVAMYKLAYRSFVGRQVARDRRAAEIERTNRELADHGIG